LLASQVVVLSILRSAARCGSAAALDDVVPRYFVL
jgi:hypothetical protein